MSAVPKEFNLGLEKPVTVPAYGRQVQSIATNAQTFSANTISNIVIDTSTPGAFLDPLQSLIEFDIEFTNTNPHIDFINFSASGAASLIQEFRIYNQGTPLIEILDYNLAFETWMKLNNMQQQEFKMYMENSWRAPVASGESDLNFVKPPMIDLNGYVMWPTNVNMFGDHNIAAKKSIGHYKAHTDIPATNITIGTAFDSTTGVNYNATAAQYDFLPAYTAKGPGAGTIPNTILNVADLGAASDPTDEWTNTGGKGPWNYQRNYNVLDANDSYTDAPGTVNSTTWTNRLDNTYITWPSTIRPEKKDSNAGILAQEQAIKTYRLEDYMMYLSNVKNIPVGISPSKTFIGATESTAISRQTDAVDFNGETLLTNWNLTNTTNTESNASSTTTLAGSFKYHVCLPFFDGLLGMGADKQFPTMLIAPGSLYIQIRWAKLEQAVQTTMDPCRRIFGTYRDYVPNVGLKSYYQTEYFGQILSYDRMTTTLKNNGVDSTSTFMAYTPHAARGTDFAWNGILATFPPTTVPTTTSNTSSATQNGLRNNIFHNNYGIWFDQEGFQYIKGIVAGTTGNLPDERVPNYQGFNEGLSTGLPKPQYVPITKPWLYSGNLFHYTGTFPSYSTELDVCYGTYLPRSTPQVRRTTSSAYPGNFSATNIAAVPTYTINNLKYSGYQTVLSDEITSAILRAAAKEDISLHGQTWTTYRTVCSTSETQTIILPIKISSANSLHMVFQNDAMRENLSYNSLSGNCPLTHFQWTADTTHYVGSDTTPVLTGLATTGSNFSIQLAIGNELLPIQPITSVTNLVSELERSVHCKGHMATPVQARANVLGNRTSSLTSTYGSLYNHDFLAPYVPIQALDDQTITDNPAFMDYLAVTYENFRQRGNYGTGLFVPPESDFILGFDLDTFPGNNDNARSGRYLGNAPLTLRMSGAKALATSSLSTLVNNLDSWSCIAIVLLDIRFSIGAGGSIQTYY